MIETIIKVKGMECTGCENRIKNALETMDGIVSVDASHATGIVNIKTNEQVSKSVISEKIADLGFEVIEED